MNPVAQVEHLDSLRGKFGTWKRLVDDGPSELPARLALAEQASPGKAQTSRVPSITGVARGPSRICGWPHVRTKYAECPIDNPSHS